MDITFLERMHTFCLNCEGKHRTELVQAVADAVKDGYVPDLIKAVETGFDGKHKQALESLYKVLFSIHQTGNQNCHLFVLEFIPSLLSIYFVSEMKSGRVIHSNVEAVLLALYNKDVIGQRETPFAKSFRIPSLSKTSVYHEPNNWRASLLTENALSRHEQSDKPVLITGPTSILSRIPAGYRYTVLQTVLQEYNSKISVLCEASHIAYCRLNIRLALTGYSSTGLCSVSGENLISFDEIAKLETLPRLPLSSGAVKDLLAGLQFVLHNGLASYAKQALDALRMHCQTSLNVPGCMIVYGMLNTLDSAGRSREKYDMPLVSNPFASRRRSEAQALPKSRKGSRISSGALSRDFVVIDSKRDELKVIRSMSRAVSDSDLRMPQLVKQANDTAAGNTVKAGVKGPTEKEVKSPMKTEVSSPAAEVYSPNVEVKGPAKTEVNSPANSPADTEVKTPTLEKPSPETQNNTSPAVNWSPSLIVTQYNESSTDHEGDESQMLKLQNIALNDVTPIIIKTEFVNSTGDLRHESVPLLVGDEEKEEYNTRI